HPDRRRLPGAVRAEEAEELTWTDVEVDRVDRPDATVVATESRDCNGGYGGHVPADSLAPRRGHRIGRPGHRIGRPVDELAVAVPERSLRRLARLHDHRVVGREVADRVGGRRVPEQRERLAAAAAEVDLLPVE